MDTANRPSKWAIELAMARAYGLSHGRPTAAAIELAKMIEKYEGHLMPVPPPPPELIVARRLAACRALPEHARKRFLSGERDYSAPIASYVTALKEMIREGLIILPN